MNATLANAAFHAVAAVTRPPAPRTFPAIREQMAYLLSSQPNDTARVHVLTANIDRLERIARLPDDQLPDGYDPILASDLIGHYVGERSRLQTKLAGDSTRDLLRRSLEMSVLLSRAEAVARRGGPGEPEDRVTISRADLWELNRAVEAVKRTAGVA
jgi:hypothetical protein